ncbi:MAG: carboxypeptidase-like regulatory domain-containing protein [Acidobacteria bacterium]|nr:carboxypeptidase-like regulatory domain-containing protein [Acidobacteriota bacterium]
MRGRQSILLRLGVCLLLASTAGAQGVRRINVTGRVVLQPANSAPPVGSMVKLYYPRSANKATLVVFTDRDGRFFFDPVEPGNYLIEVYAGNEVVYQSRVSLDGSVPVVMHNVSLRRAVSVDYYPTASQSRQLEAALNELGGQFRVRRVRTEAGDVPANTIWFGKDVPLDAVKAVALALIGKEVQIRAIRPFRDRVSENASRIEVRSYGPAASGRLWTPDRVRAVGSTSGFSR